VKKLLNKSYETKYSTLFQNMGAVPLKNSKPSQNMGAVPLKNSKPSQNMGAVPLINMGAVPILFPSGILYHYSF
jgi:hypothetical protein